MKKITYDTGETVKTFLNGLICDGCGVILNIGEDGFFDYFSNIILICPYCKKQIDLWAHTLNDIQYTSFKSITYHSIGAKEIIIETKLVPNKIYELNFSKYGVPKDSKIVQINYMTSGEGGLRPLEIHSNIPIRHYVPNEILLYPWCAGNRNCVKTDMNIFVTWLEHSKDDISWQNLINSFELYGIERYEESLVLANVAVENKIYQLLCNYLLKIVPKKRIEDFLKDACTYSYQLNVLLPTIINNTNIPKLPNNISGLLNSLRKLRNEIAHKGKTDESLNKNNVSKLLCASLFGFQYMRFVEKNLSENKRGK